MHEYSDKLMTATPFLVDERPFSLVEDDFRNNYDLTGCKLKSKDEIVELFR
jgi:hypothetical protein